MAKTTTTAYKPARVKTAPCNKHAAQRNSAQSPTSTKNASDGTATYPTKLDRLAAMLVRDEGATIDQMMSATKWLPHTVRAAMTGLKKRGYAIDSDKIDGLRTYRAVAP